MRPLLPVLLIAIAACGGDSTSPKTSPVGPSGGSVTGGDGTVVLQLPSGALTKEQPISIRALSGSEAGVAVGAVSGTAFALSPDGLALAVPASLSIYAGAASGGDDAFHELSVVRAGGANGDELPTAVSTLNRTVTASIDRLGIVWVRPARVARLVIGTRSVSLGVGTSTPLTADMFSADARILHRQVTWTVRTPAVAVLENGSAIRAVQPGSTWVVAQADDARDSVVVQVGAQVTSLAVTPLSTSLISGDTVQMQVVGRDAQGAIVPVSSASWQTSDPAIATVSQTGVLVALRTGSVSVTATVQQLSASATLAIVDAVSIAGLADLTGAPVQLGSIAGPIVVDVRAASAALPPHALSVSATCPGSSSYVASATADASGAAHVTLFTDSVDVTTGRALLLNGACTIGAQITTSKGAVRDAQGVSVTLANHSSFSARFVTTGVNAPFGTPFPSSATASDGTVWRAGNVALELQARNFDGRGLVSSIKGSFLGRSFAVTSTGTNGHFSIAYANDPNDPNGRSVAGFVSPTGGSLPTITAASYADGSAAFTNIATSAPLFLDNEAPKPALGFALPALNASIGWIAGSYQFVAGGAYVTGGDGGGVGVQSVAAYASVSPGPAALAGGSATGAACIASGWRAAPTGIAALQLLADPTTVSRQSFIARAFEVDKLGNVRCTDLSTGPFGVDVVPPTIARASTATPDLTIYGLTPSKYPFRFDVVASDAQSGLPAVKSVQRQTIAFTSAHGNICYAGGAPYCDVTAWTDTASWPGFVDARWRDSVFAVDRVGNVSAPIVTNIIDAPTDRPTFSWSGFPSPWIGGSTVNIDYTATSSFALYRTFLEVDYSYAPAAMKFEVAADTITNKWVLALYTIVPGSMRISNFMRQLEIVNGSDAPYADSTDYIAAYGLYGYAENIGGVALGTTYGFADKVMPLGYTYFGKGIQQWKITTSPTTVSNGGASGATATLSAALTLDAAVTTPFASVCFYYLDPFARPFGPNWKQAGCSTSPTTTTVGATRVLEYRVNANPAVTLGTSGSYDVRAIGMNATGDGLTTRTSRAITLVP